MRCRPIAAVLLTGCAWATGTVTAAVARPARAPHVARPAPVARPAHVLYYEAATPTGPAIEGLTLSRPRARRQVAEPGDVNLFAIAVARRHVFWSYQAGLRDRGAIMRASLAGGSPHQLVGGLAAPASMIAVGGYVYWSDQHAIGRVALNGSHLRRRFLVLPAEKGGGVADGLASDGRYLYFSRCADDTIGRVDLSGQGMVPSLVTLPPTSCPQSLAVAGGWLYWTELGHGRIGRARLNGADVDSGWLTVHTDQGPFQIVADTAHVYWTWGGVNGTPSYTGRASADGTHLDRRFLLDSLYPMALA